jgi:argininosuccinate lyase
LGAENFVRGRRGVGGPQPESVARMLEGHRKRVESARAWVTEEKMRLDERDRELNAAFEQLAGPR